MYTFFTIYTVVLVGNGEKTETPIELTPQANLKRILDYLDKFGYPILITISTDIVDLNLSENQNYYKLPYIWGKCTVSTIKFSIKGEHKDVCINGIPLPFCHEVNDIRISKFDSVSCDNNIFITTETF